MHVSLLHTPNSHTSCESQLASSLLGSASGLALPGLHTAHSEQLLEPAGAGRAENPSPLQLGSGPERWR